MSQKKPTAYQKAQRELLQYKSSDILTLAMAHREMQKTHTDKFMASGVIITITALDGRTIVGPVTVQDGLSQATIDAIKSDIKRTYDQRLAYAAIK